jgi:hypothetical protein
MDEEAESQSTELVLREQLLAAQNALCQAYRAEPRVAFREEERQARAEGEITRILHESLVALLVQRGQVDFAEYLALATSATQGELAGLSEQWMPARLARPKRP